VNASSWAAVSRGLDIDDFAGRLSFFFAAWSELFEEVAKFRAARRMWARIVRDRFGSSNVRSMMCRFHTQTAGSSLTAQQPDVNIVRTALEAMSAVLGGAQSLHTNSRDEALSLPTEESARIALRTQQIIAHETGVTNTADPTGGSECIEELTGKIEQGARAYLKQIDELGGTLRAIEAGFIQREIQNAAYQFQRSIESGERIIVGVNRFRQEGDGAIPTFRLDPALEQAQVDRLRQLRASRSQHAVEESLSVLAEAARTGANLMPPILKAAEAYVTVGEISARLKTVFGEYREA